MLDQRPDAQPSDRDDFAMLMTWRHLLFAHWPFPPAVLQAVLPEPLVVDTFEGQAWLGVVPLFMDDVRVRYAPPIPTAHQFPELNVRTYVRVGSQTGIYFFTLDADSLVTVTAARQLHLNYMNARMTCEMRGVETYFTSERTHLGAPPATFKANYVGAGERFTTKDGTLEHWLTSRFQLLTVDRNASVALIEVEHPEWTLRNAEATFEVNTMTEALGFGLPATAPHLMIAEDLRVKARWPTPL